MLLAHTLETATRPLRREAPSWWPVLWATRDAAAENAALRRRVRVLERTVERLESQAQVLHQFAVLGSMTAGIVHDLGSPLTCVSGHLEMVRMGELSASQREDIEAMSRGVDRLRALTALLLSFLRRGGGPHQRLRLCDIVERALSICSYIINRKSIDVSRTVPDDLPHVNGDAPLLEGVIINLVDNAVRAMRPGGRLRLEARPASGGVELLVADDGHGIAPEVLERLFEPLTTSRPGSDGHGIGLAFARQVVERHGGALTADSVRGQGTTFSVWLPEAPAPRDDQPE